MKTPPKNPYQEFNEAYDRLWAAIYEALRMPQILDWMTQQLNKLK